MKITKSAFSLIELSIVILIIGILVIGISKGSRIISEARLKTARSITTSSPVASISNLVFWLDATDPATIATGSAGSGVYTNSPNNGNLVTDWKDRNPQKTNPIAVSATVDANRPTYIRNGINGLPTIQFDGTNSELNNASSVISGGKKDYTLIVVFKMLTVNSSQRPFIQRPVPSGGCSGTYAGFLMYLIDSTHSSIGSFNCGGADIIFSPTITVKTPYIAILKINRYLGSSNSTLYLNNLTDTGTATFTNNLLDGPTTVGGGSLEDDHFNGYISEEIIFDRALSNVEITEIKNYLSKKYSIKI